VNKISSLQGGAQRAVLGVRQCLRGRWMDLGAAIWNLL